MASKSKKRVQKQKAKQKVKPKRHRIQRTEKLFYASVLGFIFIWNVTILLAMHLYDNTVILSTLEFSIPEFPGWALEWNAAIGDDKQKEAIRTRYPLESTDPILVDHMWEFCTEEPCKKNVTDFLWPHIFFVTAEERDMYARSAVIERSVDKTMGTVNGTNPLFLHAELLKIHNGSITTIDCGWGSKHEEFNPGKGASNDGPHLKRALPLSVPDGFSFQHFVDGTLPKIMMHLDVIQDKKIDVVIARPRDKIIFELFERLGLSSQLQIMGTHFKGKADELYSGCIVPPFHPMLWRRARVLLTKRAPTPKPNGPIILVRRTRNNAKNRGRLIDNYDELKAGLEAEFHDQLVEFDSKNFSPNSTIELFASASAVIGSHGGALTNLLFSPMETVVIEAMPCKAKSGDPILGHAGNNFYAFASLLGQTYWRLQVISQKGNVVIDPATVIGILKNPRESPFSHELERKSEALISSLK